MALKQFQTQDGVRISNTPGSIQIENRTLGAGDAVSISVGNADYFAIVNRALNQDNGVESSAVAYDSSNNMVTLHVSEVYNPSTDIYKDILIISKFDSSANLLWQKQLTDDVDVDVVHDICIDNSDNIVVATSIDNGDDPDSILIIKLDAAGNILWQKDYLGAEEDPNYSFQELGGVVCDTSSIYVAGEYIQNFEGPADQRQALILKISLSNGALTWAKKFNLNVNTRLYGMDVAVDGTLAVVGVAEPGDAPNAAFVTKLNGDGSQVWTKILFNPDEQIDYSGADVTLDTQGNIIVSFNSQQTIEHESSNQTVSISHLIKMDGDGDTDWVRRIGPGPCASVGTGIDCDNLGNIYLSALTVVQQNPVRDIDNFFTSKNVLAVAKFAASGVPTWQRYIEAQGYSYAPSRDEGDSPGTFNYNVNRGRYLSLTSNGKMAVQVTAKQLDTNDNVPDTQYWESITFQIDQDGRTLTLGSGNELFNVKESRIPGRFITVPEFTTAELTVTDITNSFEVTTTTKTLEEGLLAQHTAKSASYDYVFGNDGTVTVPNDGDLRLVQTQIGWFSILGPANNNIDDVWIRASCVDSDTGDVYAVGQDNDSNDGLAVRYNSEGQILWVVRLFDLDNSNNTRCNAVKIIPNSKNIMVLCEYFGNEVGALLVEIDPDTAVVVSSSGFRDENENNTVNAYDFDFFSDSNIVVVGRKYDEYSSLQITPQTGSTTGTLIVSNAQVQAGSPVYPVTNSWTVTGTGITGRATISDVNKYDAITGTTQQGSGAVFSITDNGSGGYVVAGVSSGGTNYLVGHKIKILGTSVGGSTPANDAIISVTEASGGAITNASVSGTAAGASPTTYTGLSGTNYQVGSGFQLDFSYDNDYANAGWGNFNAGSNYVQGDIITVPGTSLGGTSPTNDLTVTVTSVGGSGDIGGFLFTGTPQSTTRKLTVNQAVNFGGAGTWSVGYDLGGEAFVWTNTWNKVLSAGGQYDSERYLSVSVDSNNNVYAAGEMISRDGAAGPNLNDIWCAVVSKFNSTGTHQWTKALNNNTNDCYAKGVAARGNVVTVTYENGVDGDTVITKLLADGTIQWQRISNSNDDSSVAIDSNGDIYVAMEYNFGTQYEDVIKVMRLASNGEPIWRKFFGTLAYTYGGTNERFKNGRNLTIDDASLYVSGYTTAFNDNFENGFLVKLPKSGDCDGSYGVWTVQTDLYDVSKVSSTEATTFTPVVSTGNFEIWEPSFETNWWDPSDGSTYHTLQEIRDRDGGAIEFADGTRQTSSAQIIPQVKISNGADHRLSPEDAGKHIYVTDSNTSVIIPYDEDSPLVVGFTVVIVNNSGGTINVDADGVSIYIVVPGSGSYQYWDLANEGMATLLKVDTNTWFMTGNVTQD